MNLSAGVEEDAIESPRAEAPTNPMFTKNLALGVLFTLSVSAQSNYFRYSKDSFFATGSWESPDPKIKTDMTETQVDCFREIKTCVLATADNLMGRPPCLHQLSGCHQVGRRRAHCDGLKPNMYDAHDAGFRRRQAHHVSACSETT